MVLAAVAASSLFGMLGGCSASSNTDDDGFSGSGAGDSSGSAGGDSVGSFSGGVGGATGSGGMDACASEVFDGVQVPLDMYVMLDKSSSMDSNGKWQNVTNALSTFFSDAGSAGIGVGLQFFPLQSANPPPSSCMTDQDCGQYGPCFPMLNICLGAANADSCEPMDYANPAEAIATLPMAASALQSRMNGESPDGASTPTGTALAGAREYATQWAAANPTHLTYILFATDGDPTGCSGDAQAEAAAAAAANPSVKTFVIGVGPELGFLNGVAQAGGTGQAFLVDAGPNTTQQFLDALADIRNTGACSLQIPAPTDGVPNYDLVNVTLVDSNDPNSRETIGRVAGVSACGPQGGWYYNDPQNPTIIELCPATCDRVRSQGLDVEVVLGCETIVQ